MKPNVENSTKIIVGASVAGVQFLSVAKMYKLIFSEPSTGLAAAIALKDSQHNVIILEKDRELGGTGVRIKISTHCGC